MLVSRPQSRGRVEKPKTSVLVLQIEENNEIFNTGMCLPQLAHAGRCRSRNPLISLIKVPFIRDVHITTRFYHVKCIKSRFQHPAKA